MSQEASDTEFAAFFLGGSHMTKTIGMVLLLIGLSGLALAGGTNVPEIDSGSAVAAIALFSGALLVLRARRKK